MLDKIVLADFSLFPAPSICPKMTNNLLTIHKYFKLDSSILILSHTVWPEVDDVNVLYRYAEKYGVDHKYWRFLTGEKQELYRLARQDYLVAPDINDLNFQHGGDADFIHTENIVLIDQNKE